MRDLDEEYIAKAHKIVSRGMDMPADEAARFTKALIDTRAELEVERMRLAACGVAASCNTEKSIKQHGIDKDSPYWSDSYAQVCATVQREMALRETLSDVVVCFGDTHGRDGASVLIVSPGHVLIKALDRARSLVTG